MGEKEYQDRSFLYGDALFETVRVTQFGAQRLPLHIARFSSSALELGYPDDLIKEGIRALQDLQNPSKSALIGLWKITITRPQSAAPFPGSHGIQRRHRPLLTLKSPSLMTLPNTYFPQNPFAKHKTTSFFHNVEARRRAKIAGFDDVIMVSPFDKIGESSAANLFLVIGNKLFTPPLKGILPGTTRAQILQMAPSKGVEIIETPLSIADLQQAKEVILTSSGVLALSAKQVNKRPLELEWGPILTKWLEE